MDEKEIEALAHRMAWRYAKSRDPKHSDTYTFNRYCLLQFAGRLLAAAPAPTPLTDEQIEALRCIDDCGEAAAEFSRIVRIAERAHGIGTDAAPAQHPDTADAERCRPLAARLSVLRVLLAQNHPEHHKTVHEAERALEAGRASRGMFVARLENMQASGDQCLTVTAVLALLNDCDMLTEREVVDATRAQAQKVEAFGWLTPERRLKVLERLQTEAERAQAQKGE